ncbi:MAG: 50S ribosomal protein L29 [Aureispira sp.]|nr:50S ribosomal protein L29 [Aureispira sp.]
MAEKKDFKSLSTEDLQAELQTTEQTYQSLKFNNAIATLENPKQLTALRKDIARIKTELRAKELETSEVPRDRIQARRRRAKKNK